MQQEYYQIYLLLDSLDQWHLRLNKMKKIIQNANFQYSQENGADALVGIFLKSSYWLDKELFDESYLYQSEKGNLSGIQEAHFEMVDIGANLLNKGFPLEYDASEYVVTGPNVLAPYVENFVKQCHKRYDIFYGENSRRNVPTLPQKISNAR